MPDPLSPSGPTSGERFAYVIACPCGTTPTGWRTASFQEIPCPQCGRRLIAFPAHPWLVGPGAASPSDRSAAEPVRRSEGRNSLLFWPVLAGASTLALLIGFYLVVLGPILSRNGKLPPVAPEDPEPADALVRARDLLGKGQFRRAVETLEALSERPGIDKKSSVLRQQLHREAALLADLSAEPLEDLLLHAAATAPEEWKAESRRRYRGRAFVFQATFEKKAGGWESDYPLVTERGEMVRILWDGLAAFDSLPGPGPQLLVIGARLESLEVEAPGPVWTLRWQSGSGVFLTSAPALRSCCPDLDGPELEALVRRQFRWATGLPTPE